MAVRSLSPEELEQARDHQILILVGKWRKRELLKRADYDEIRHVIGEAEYAKWIAKLDELPSDAYGRISYLHELKEYALIYKRSERQIKRWIKAGRYAKPPDMPPLDQEGQMLSWWNRMQLMGQLKQKP